MRHAASDSRSVAVITSPSAAIASSHCSWRRVVEPVDLEHHERDRLERTPRRGDALLDEHLVVLLAEQSGHGVHDGLRLRLGEGQVVGAARARLLGEDRGQGVELAAQPVALVDDAGVLVLDAAEPGADRRRADRGEEPEAARDEPDVGQVGDARDHAGDERGESGRDGVGDTPILHAGCIGASAGSVEGFRAVFAVFGGQIGEVVHDRRQLVVLGRVHPGDPLRPRGPGRRPAG